MSVDLGIVLDRRTVSSLAQGVRESREVGALPSPHGRDALAGGRARRGLQRHGAQGLRGRGPVGEDPRDAQGHEGFGGEPVGEVCGCGVYVCVGGG